MWQIALTNHTSKAAALLLQGVFPNSRNLGRWIKLAGKNGVTKLGRNPKANHLGRKKKTRKSWEKLPTSTG